MTNFASGFLCGYFAATIVVVWLCVRAMRAARDAWKE